METTSDGLILCVHVQPSARKDELSGVHAGLLKIRLNAPAVDGRANRRLREYLSELFGIRKSSVEITSGQGSRTKRIKLTGVEKEVVERVISTLLSS